MVRGLYTAGTGMLVQTKRMDIISNDLANSNTTGYKKDVAVVESFDEVLMKRVGGSQYPPFNYKDLGTITNGVRIEGVYTDFRAGNLVYTGISNNLAINGSGFFVVETPNGERLTRDGSFTITPDGALVTQEGYPVMGDNGPINVGRTFFNEGLDMKVLPTREILIGTNVIDTINVVNVEDPQLLEKEADNLYINNQDFLASNATIEQGFLESSNVNPVTAMVDMITVSRAYEANQKMIQTHDSLIGKAVNEVGKA